MNIPTKTTSAVHSPFAVTKISLAFVPITAGGKTPIGKTPLEAEQESRIPKPGTFDRYKNATTKEQRQAVQSCIVLGALTEPKSSVQVAEQIGEDQRRVAKAMSLMENRGEVVRIKNPGGSTLWCKPGTVYKGIKRTASAKAKSWDEYMREVADRKADRRKAILELVKSGVSTIAEIRIAIGISEGMTGDIMREMKEDGILTSEIRNVQGGRRMVYEVAK